jgi:hypothetical protein
VAVVEQVADNKLPTVVIQDLVDLVAALPHGQTCNTAD